MKTITVTVFDEMAASLLALSEVFEREPGAMLEEVAGFVFKQIDFEDFAEEFEWTNYDTREQAERVGRKAVEYRR